MKDLCPENHSEQKIECHLFHQDFHIAGSVVGDTAYYEPERRGVIHYKGPRWFLINGAVSSDSLMPNYDITQTEDTFPDILAGLHQ
jgi:hypothetical protein